MIKWNKVSPQARYSGYSGIDADGNVYYMTHNCVKVWVYMADGRNGAGKDAQEAIENALRGDKRENSKRKKTCRKYYAVSGV